MPPYTGPNDKTLPPAARGLFRQQRKLWVAAFNANYDPNDESIAFRAAWGAVRSADKEKKMTTVKQMIAGLRKPAEKTVNLSKWESAVHRAFAEQFGVEPGQLREDEIDNTPWVFEVHDEHCIVRMYDGNWFKVPYSKTMGAVDGNDEEVVTAVTFAPRAEWTQVVPVFSEFKAYKQDDGRVRFVLVSSGGFEDRDGEVVSTAFLESAVKEADRTGARGPLLIYHVPGSNIGTVDMQAVIGAPGILLETGTFDDTPDGRRAAEYYLGHASKETGVSIKFLYANQTPDGVFLPPGLIIERSLLPKDKAAFPWSALDIAEVQTMAKLSQAKQTMLEEVLGRDRAVDIIAQIETSAEALKEAGVRFKELSAPAVDGATEEAASEPDQATEQTPTDGPAGEATKEADASAELALGQLENFELVLSPEAIDAVAEKAAGAVREQLTGLQAQIQALQGALDGQSALRTVVEKLAQDMDALKRADDLKVAEKVAHLPKATVRAMQAPQLYRATQAKAAEDDESEAAGGGETYLDLIQKTVRG